jgi:hypothetical protein
MGGLSQLTKNESSAWNGGKPKFDWSGLEGNPQSYTSPNHLRPVSVTAAQKSYNRRKAGIATKFKRDDDLFDFQRQVWDHLSDNDMDTIAHLPDPSNPSRMMNVVKEPSRFALATVKELVQAAQKIASHFNMARINLGLSPVDNAATPKLLIAFAKPFRKKLGCPSFGILAPASLYRVIALTSLEN